MKDSLMFRSSILITKAWGNYTGKQSAITLEHFTDMLIHAIFIHPPKEIQSSFSLPTRWVIPKKYSSAFCQLFK